MKKAARKSSPDSKSSPNRKVAPKRKVAKVTPGSVRAEAVTSDGDITKGAGFARTVIYVHGIGNKPSPSVLKCQWDHALFGFDLGERSRLAYWVNRAYYPNPETGNCGSGDRILLETQPTGEGLTVKEHMAAVTLEEEVKAVATRKSDKDKLLSIAETMERANDRGSGVTAASVEAKVFPFLPQPIREWITRQLVRAFLRDVNDYMYVDARRDVMKKSLLDRLDVGGGPFVVVAHSQGSMIAYDVLCGLDPAKYKVPLFVTVGSPLGVDEVQDQIRKLTGQKTLKKPACVDQWMNFADIIDPVASDKNLSGDYVPAADITDTIVRNLDSPKSPHSGTGYLGLAVVQTAVRKVVDTSLFQRVAPFLIAKDLVHDMENDGQSRHKTLIELTSPAHDDVRTIEERRIEVTTILKESATKRNISHADLRIENLRRYVAADLTRSETETLATEGGIHQKSVERIWKNAAKGAYLDVSVDTVQARTAHAGYNARGKNIDWAVLDTGVVHHPHFKQFKNIVAEFDCTSIGIIVHAKT